MSVRLNLRGVYRLYLSGKRSANKFRKICNYGTLFAKTIIDTQTKVNDMRKAPNRTPVQNRGPSMNVKFHVDERGVTEVKLETSESNRGLEWEIIGKGSPLLKGLIEKWIESYSKKRPPDVFLPVVLDGLPPYTTRVLSILRDIPFGISLSYKELAEITGNPQGARAVGNACSRNPCPLIIPCHRVLAAEARLGGFSCGVEIKKTLLSFENVPFI